MIRPPHQVIAVGEGDLAGHIHLTLPQPLRPSRHPYVVGQTACAPAGCGTDGVASSAQDTLARVDVDDILCVVKGDGGVGLPSTWSDCVCSMSRSAKHPPPADHSARYGENVRQRIVCRTKGACDQRLNAQSDQPKQQGAGHSSRQLPTTRGRGPCGCIRQAHWVKTSRRSLCTSRIVNPCRFPFAFRTCR